MKIRMLFLGVAVHLATVNPALAQRALVPSEQLNEQIKVIDVSFDRHSVSGRLINRTPSTLRDIRLEVRLTWHWANETSPGAESPGRTGYYRVPGELAPDGELRFSFRLAPPLSERTDGRFSVSVGVTGFTEVTNE